jgi:hypothetical protein
VQIISPNPLCTGLSSVRLPHDGSGTELLLLVPSLAGIVVHSAARTGQLSPTLRSSSSQVSVRALRAHCGR